MNRLRVGLCFFHNHNEGIHPPFSTMFSVTDYDKSYCSSTLFSYTHISSNVPLMCRSETHSLQCVKTRQISSYS